MKSILNLYIILIALFLGSCQKNKTNPTQASKYPKNEIRYANGFELYSFENFSVLKISKPWPGATKIDTYVLKKENAVVPDSLKNYQNITVPIQKIVVTSTTHIPALELLNEENSLIGFPNTDFISSPKTRKRIEEGKVKEVGHNEALNTEILLDLSPDVVVSFGINNSNPVLENLQKSGLKVLLNGDWNEQSPLGKSEWLKLFGALYDKKNQATSIFNEIEKEYLKTKSLAQKLKKQPSILCGAMYQDQWFVPQGESWMAIYLKDAKSNYLWSDTKGTASVALSFETVFDKAKNAEFWIAPGDFVSLAEMQKNNPHYVEFESFKNKKVFSYSLHKGAKGGIKFFEWASTRPDWVLKDLIAILHPELLPKHDFYFFEKLN